MERLIMLICIASISFSTPAEQANPYPLIVLFLEIGVFPSGCSYRIMTLNRDGLHFLETRCCVSHRAPT